MKRLHFTLCAALLMAVACGAPQQEGSGVSPAELIPAPVEYQVPPGCIPSQALAQLTPKVRISEKALQSRLQGRTLTDWQLQ